VFPEESLYPRVFKSSIFALPEIVGYACWTHPAKMYVEVESAAGRAEDWVLTIAVALSACSLRACETKRLLRACWRLNLATPNWSPASPSCSLSLDTRILALSRAE